MCFLVVVPDERGVLHVEHASVLEVRHGRRTSLGEQREREFFR